MKEWLAIVVAVLIADLVWVDIIDPFLNSRRPKAAFVNPDHYRPRKSWTISFLRKIRRGLL